VQPVRKKTGWVWMREWMEKEGKDRVEGGRRDRERMEVISDHLKELRVRAERWKTRKRGGSSRVLEVLGSLRKRDR